MGMSNYQLGKPIFFWEGPSASSAVEATPECLHGLDSSPALLHLSLDHWETMGNHHPRVITFFMGPINHPLK